MKIFRRYLNISFNIGAMVVLDAGSAHYVRTVLRLKEGDSLILFNGQGGEYLATLSEVSRKNVRAMVESFIERDVESPLQVTLGLGVSRGDRMDWALQKAVELGVARIVPLLTARCQVKMDEDKKAQRCQHWRHIVQHAVEQSGRTILPVLDDVDTLPSWVVNQQGVKIFLDPYAQHSLADLQPENQQVTLLSGPESGFSDDERVQAQLAGFVPVRLGARILRTETAALAALTAVQTLWGDFN